MTDRIRICVREKEITHKVTSIYLLNDGSFKIDIPYCVHKKGVVEKFEFPDDAYNKIQFVVEKSDTDSFFVRNRPQLSVHASGFVQFSGKGITSGVDHDTGLPKGMAIKSVPLETPIGTGPTCGVIFWGLSGYEIADKWDDINFVIPSEVFEPRKHGEEIPNAYQLEVWVFPDDEYYRKSIKADPNGNEYIKLRFPNYLPAPNTAFVMRVIRLKSIKAFLAILPSKIYSQFAKESEFGFYMSTPSEKTKEGKWRAMHAVSPAPENEAFYISKDLPYLDYNSPKAT